MASTNPSSREPDDTFWVEVAEQIRVPDIALLLTVPVVLTAVYLLLASIQQTLVLDYQNPSIHNLWTAAYVHRGFAHFSNNLAAYCVSIVPSYLLFVLAGERRLFQYTLFSFLFVLPPVLAAVNIAVIDQGTGVGFSGIGAAVVGLVPAALFVFIQNRVSHEVGPSNGVAVFLVVLGGIAATYNGVAAGAGILLVACVLAVYSIHGIGVNEVRRAGADLFSMNGYWQLVVIAVVLYLFSPMALFPQEIVQDGHRINILSHYAGLVLGFFGPTVLSTYWE